MFYRLPFSHIISGLPDIILGLTFLVTWIDPTALGDDMVPFLFQVMLLEFIIIHSSGFMGALMFSKIDRKKKFISFLLLGGFYMLFAGSFAWGFQSWWPVIAFGGLLFNRMLSILTGQSPDGNEQFFAMKMWGVSVAFYLLTVFFAILIPLPALGISSDLLSHLDISGEFVDEPHLMIAWGFLYFTLTGLYEFSLFREIDHHTNGKINSDVGVQVD